MATVTKFQDYSEQFARGIHDWDSHTFKVALTNSAPVATNTVLGDITQISGTNGYTTGGATTTIGVSESSGTTTVTGTQVSWTASGGSVGPFQYMVLYNDTSASDNLVAFWNHGSAVTLSSGDSFTFKFNSASPGTIFTLA